MKCLQCPSQIPVPPEKDNAVCPACGAVYEYVDDIGWFGEFIGVYIPKKEKPGPSQ